MPMIVPQFGARYLLTRLATDMNPSDVRLFKNDITPGQATVLADFTEADFSGYAPASINAWSAPITVDGRAKMLANLVEWIHDGGGVNNSIYGVYVLVATEFVWAERFVGAPIVMQAGSPALQYIPAFTGISEFLT